MGSFFLLMLECHPDRFFMLSRLQDFFTEANQSHMNALIPKLQEANRCLNELISCTGMVSLSFVFLCFRI